jgi:hypothetical protein
VTRPGALPSDPTYLACVQTRVSWSFGSYHSFRQSRSPPVNTRCGLVNRSDLPQNRCLDSHYIIRRLREALYSLILTFQREIKISSSSNFVQIPSSSLTMDMSIQIPMVGYFIYRSGEQADPTALEFCPPKGSDELFCNNKHSLYHVSMTDKS